LLYRKTKQQLVDDNEQVARIALYLPQLHTQKEKLEADLQELEHLALSDRPAKIRSLDESQGIHLRERMVPRFSHGSVCPADL
jgi:hypothetical protein